jgi:Ser/Thr protein kinase RdoA (MazF antagonist)
MEEFIRQLYSDEMLHEARQRFGIAAEQIQLLDGFESFMFAFERPDGQFILRLAHSRRRSVALIQGEVDWINYLADGGVGVARAVNSENGYLVEQLDDGQGGAFLATAFVRAQGGPPWENGRWNDELIVSYGRLLGRIHELTKNYIPRHPNAVRPQWDDNVNMDITLELAVIDPTIYQKYNDVVTYLQSLHKSQSSYGLIHQDAHAGNFFVNDEGQITLFDFDDCVYSWFIYDIAMVLFYTATNRPEPEQHLQHFWPLFWQGYCLENELDQSWLHELPFFMKLREIELYAVIMRDYADSYAKDRWMAQFMNGRRARIVNDVPYLQTGFFVK